MSSPEVVADQRARLVKAMTELVAEAGYRAASVALVIKRAGVSRKTFYELFEDRAACFAAAHAEAVAAIKRALRAPDGLAALVELYGERPELFDLAFVAATVAGPDEVGRYLRHCDHCASWLAGRPELGQAIADIGAAAPARAYPPELARMALAGLVASFSRGASEAGAGGGVNRAEAMRLALAPWLGPEGAQRAGVEALG